MGLGLVGKLTVMFGADMKGFNRAMKNAEKSLNKTARNFKKIGNSLTTNVTLPVLGLGAASVKLASDLEESMNKVRVSFGDSAKVIEDFSDTTLMSFGIAKGSALEMAALFGDMGTSLGMGQEEAAEMSKNLVGLAGDLASFKNVSIEVAQTGLAGIFTGETESLKKLGIMTQEATLKNSEYFLSLNKSWKELTQLEKIQIRYNEVLRQSNNAVGDFVNTQDSFANQFRILQESIKETGAELGKELIPLAKDLVSIATNLTKRLNSLNDEQRKNLVQYSLIAAALGPLLLALSSLLNIIKRILPFIGKFVTVLRNLTPQGRIITAVVTGIGFLISKFKGKGSLEEAVTDADDSLANFNITFDKFGRMQKKYKDTGFRMMGVDSPTTNAASSDTKKDDTPFISLIDVKKLREIPKFERNWKKYYETIEAGIQKTSNAWDEATKKQKEFNNEIRMNFEGAMYNAMTSQENFFDAFISNFKRALGQMAAARISENLTSILFGALTLPTGGGIGGFLGKILGLANGGLVTGPTLAMVGEGGSTISNPEVVAPLDKLRSMMGGNVQQIEVQGRLSGRDIFLSNSKTSNSRFRST